MGGSIFISYRRGADGGFAGRLYDRLERTFRRRLFMDVDSIAPGEDFVAILEARVAECDVLLALIGRGWLGATDAAGRRRLDNPDDFVRIEVASGLAQGKRVIPVLIDDAPMPGTDELPDDLKPLARRQALPLSHERFKIDADRLVRALKQAFAEADKARALSAAAPSPGPAGHPLPQAGEGEGESPLPPGEGGADAPGEGQPIMEHSGADLEVALSSSAEPTPQPVPPTPPSPSRVAGPSLSQKERELSSPGPADLPDLAIFRDIDAPWCPEMVVLPAGEFLMGSPEKEKWRERQEGPQHRVAISFRFALGRYAVTFQQYDHFCELTRRERPKDRGWGRGRRPVIYVSWLDARAYVNWLAKESGQPYRLPSEAEWEYACRAGTTTRFAFGDNVTKELANYGRLVLGQTKEVGSYPPNPWGLYEMHSNVWEWVEDPWHENYNGSPSNGSAWTQGAGVSSSDQRVIRGGAFDVVPANFRSAVRAGCHPDSRAGSLGFRVARTLD